MLICPETITMHKRNYVIVVAKNVASVWLWVRTSKTHDVSDHVKFSNIILSIIIVLLLLLEDGEPEATKNYIITDGPPGTIMRYHCRLHSRANQPKTSIPNPHTHKRQNGNLRQPPRTLLDPTKYYVVPATADTTMTTSITSYHDRIAKQIKHDESLGHQIPHPWIAQNMGCTQRITHRGKFGPRGKQLTRARSQNRWATGHTHPMPYLAAC